MKNLIYFLFIYLLCTFNVVAEDKLINFPYKNAVIEKIYKLDDGKFIYIEQTGRGDFIWEYDPKIKEFKQISKVWSFIDLASKCEMVDGYNIYFANILEYWFAGGNNIDYPEIRIFDLYERKPWRNNDLGIAPSMKYAKNYCNFYKPYFTSD